MVETPRTTVRFQAKCSCQRVLEPKLSISGDFLGSPVVKNQSSNAGNVDLIPGQGIKIPQASGQLSP